ncbi:sialidase family protein [Sinomonas sp. ASV486]|nr:sialidase family protein [Sinomonas sp. ASV486]
MIGFPDKENAVIHQHFRYVAALTLLPAALLLTPSVASAATATPPVTASGTSPFATCTLGAAPGAVNYPNAEVEPWVAVNPTNPRNIIGVWQQDRWSDGGSHGLVAGYSTNGGKTWNETAQPFSACAGGPARYDRASDPWVSIGPDGTAYSVSISFQGVGSDNAVLASTSTDGGATWTAPKALIEDLGTSQFFNDKESVTADPNTPGTAYAVWDRLVSPTDNPRSAAHAAAYTGPTYFSKTTDGGKSWSPATAIVPTAQNQQTIGNQIVVDPRNGTLYNVFDLILGTGKNGVDQLHGTNVAYTKSTDGGTTWTAPQVIAQLNTVGVTDPNTGAAVRTGDIIPEPAIDPATGQLYVVWQDSRFNGGHYDEVAISTSADGGATWSAPAQVNAPHGAPAFTPSVRVANGTVGVTYYDFRSLAAGNTSTLPTDYWFTSLPAGGVSFGNETHLYGPFDMMTAPNARGFFTGDYQGLAAIGAQFGSLSVRANSGSTDNRTDAVFTRVTP